MSKEKEPIRQVFDPKAHQERTEAALDKLHAQIYDDQQAMEKRKTQREKNTNLLRLKANSTDVPLAQVAKHA